MDSTQGSYSRVWIGVFARRNISYHLVIYFESMRRIFRTRTFTRLARNAGVKDADLLQAVEEMLAGLIDADWVDA